MVYAVKHQKPSLEIITPVISCGISTNNHFHTKLVLTNYN